MPWASNVRFSNSSAESVRTQVAAPARHVHCDLSPSFTPAMLNKLPGAAAAAAEMEGRLGSNQPKLWRVVNIWQVISPPPQDTPLALCDTWSIAAKDIIIASGREGSGPAVELSLFQHNPQHRWYYFADMQPGETLVFSAIDPAAGPTFGVVPHTAFDNPDCPPDAPPHSSIEVRALTIFDA